MAELQFRSTFVGFQSPSSWPGHQASLKKKKRKKRIWGVTGPLCVPLFSLLLTPPTACLSSFPLLFPSNICGMWTIWGPGQDSSPRPSHDLRAQGSASTSLNAGGGVDPSPQGKLSAPLPLPSQGRRGDLNWLMRLKRNPFPFPIIPSFRLASSFLPLGTVLPPWNTHSAFLPPDRLQPHWGGAGRGWSRAAHGWWVGSSIPRSISAHPGVCHPIHS